MEDMVKLEYNTESERLVMPEYGRNVLKMVEDMKKIPDRDKRCAQAKAIVKAMELLNPQVRQQEDYNHKLWDHLYIISGFDLDVDAPYPCPVKEEFETKPLPLPMKGEKIQARHYGRNIEKMIDLICEEPEGEMKNALIHSLATYMRQQYLIWNKDSVADATVFADLEKLSGGRLKVPADMTLEKVQADVVLARPGMAVPGQRRRKRNFKQKRK